MLEEIFLIKRIPAWSRNLSARATATPKVAMVDSGIASNLLGVDATHFKRPGSPFGALLEGFVLMELARQLTWSDERAELSHYRTRDQVEVDAVLENRRGQVVGIEVKAASTVRAEDFRGAPSRRPARRRSDRRAGALHRWADAVVRSAAQGPADQCGVGGGAVGVRAGLRGGRRRPGCWR